MPEAVTFHYHNENHTIYFPQSNALLPVKLMNGEMKLVRWGRRIQEKSDMPLGGWARLDAIQRGSWSLYFPKPVRLPIVKFMKTDYEGRLHWYDMSKGQWIQGLLAHMDDEYRVYIVTITPERLDIAFDRWPRIVMR